MVLERILVRQAGVITLAQARDCGISADTVRRRVRAGAWRQLHPCVYLAGGHRLVRLLQEAGIGGWVLGHPFGPYRIDLAFPAERVAIEVDGRTWHVDAERLRADHRKGNALTRGSWDLLRFPWHTLDGEPRACIAEVAATLGLAGRRLA